MAFRRFLPSNRRSYTDQIDQSSLQSERPPTYTSNVTYSPTYTPNVTPTSTGAHGPNDGERARSASITTAPVLSAPDSEALLNNFNATYAPTYTPNVTSTPTSTGAHGPDDGMRERSASVTTAPALSAQALLAETKSSLIDTVSVAETSVEVTATAGPRYIYYRVYAEDGAIPSKTSFTPGNSFLGRVKSTSVPPPHTAEKVKRCIAKAENIDDYTLTCLFLTPSSQSPMDDNLKVAILQRTGMGSIPQEPLALVGKLSGAERIALESADRGEHEGPLDDDTTSSNTRYLYYRLYTEDTEMPSKVAIDPEEPSLGRIPADSIAPPHNPTSIKRCISAVENTPALASAHLFTDMSCDTPLTEGHISILHTDGPGLSPDEPMALVQVNEAPDGPETSETYQVFPGGFVSDIHLRHYI